MKEFGEWIKLKLTVDKRLIFTYCIIYFSWGILMNWFGAEVQIAKFTYWWQVVTCYILYMVPVSLLLRGLPFHAQYAYGLVAMCLLEFGGYALETSYAYPNNLLDQFFNERNFSLAMALFFALYFPMGNWLVGKVYRAIFK
ncbi:hypothetical protein MTsPCn9_06260 [Croceitalea sp. MTPC9]|uniref:hypothetical protein n=1 Tax=unclassified Croceitalea TaxID=2632280 RepID=UPI002B3F3849|nr:hypothetical protein MTsPCn6_02450 [Croceitalea sp. MTPC6]GMN15690.1 hypothetical protein MTsPCn9_06260 [Croceitalea sp. MTPC9]